MTKGCGWVGWVKDYNSDNGHFFQSLFKASLNFFESIRIRKKQTNYIHYTL